MTTTHKSHRFLILCTFGGNFRLLTLIPVILTNGMVQVTSFWFLFSDLGQWVNYLHFSYLALVLLVSLFNLYVWHFATDIGLHKSQTQQELGFEDFDVPRRKRRRQLFMGIFFLFWAYISILLVWSAIKFNSTVFVSWDWVKPTFITVHSIVAVIGYVLGTILIVVKDFKYFEYQKQLKV